MGCSFFFTKIDVEHFFQLSFNEVFILQFKQLFNTNQFKLFETMSSYIIHSLNIDFNHCLYNVYGIFIVYTAKYATDINLCLCVYNNE